MGFPSERVETRVRQHAEGQHVIEARRSEGQMLGVSEIEPYREALSGDTQRRTAASKEMLRTASALAGPWSRSPRPGSTSPSAPRPPGSGRRRPHIAIHRSPLPPDHVTCHDGIPVTTPDRTLIDMAVGFSNRDAAHAMTRELIRSGYRRIVFVNGPSTGNERARRRSEGYRAAMKEAEQAKESGEEKVIVFNLSEDPRRGKLPLHHGPAALAPDRSHLGGGRAPDSGEWDRRLPRLRPSGLVGRPH